MKSLRLHLISLGFFLAAAFTFAAAPTPEPIVAGNSAIMRDNVTFHLHVPPTLPETHGPAGVLIWFTGSDENPGKYPRSFGAMADALDLIVIVPQMPWSNPKGTVPPPGVFRATDKLLEEMAVQFQTSPDLIVVGGASAGGGSAADFAKKESKTALLVLASTGPFQTPSRIRTLHVVGDNEASRLGGRPQLGRGKKDTFAVPNGQHAPQFPHDIAWLETEVSAWRLEHAAQTMRLAEDKLAKGDTVAAQAILKSTLDAINILKAPASGNDEFFTHQTKYRQELLTKNAMVIQSIERLNAKLAPKPTPEATPESTPTPSPEASSAAEAAATSEATTAHAPGTLETAATPSAETANATDSLQEVATASPEATATPTPETALPTPAPAMP